MKKILLILLGIVAVAVITMFVMGKSYHFEKSIVINAPLDKVYAHLNNTKSITNGIRG